MMFGKFWLIVLISAAILWGIGQVVMIAGQTETFRIPVLVSGSIPAVWGWTTYMPRSFTLDFKRGETVVLSALPTGEGNIFVNTQLSITVIHPDGTKAGEDFVFCNSLCICDDLSPPELTSLLEPGRNQVLVTLSSWCGSLTSTDLYLVKSTKTSPFRIIRMMTRKVVQLQRETAWLKTSWKASLITKELRRALRYAYYSSFRPRYSSIAQTMIDNSIELLDNIDLATLIARVKEGLPELRGETEALMKLHEALGETGQEMLTKVEKLYDLLCALDPSASDCTDIIPVTTVGVTWPYIQAELRAVKELLEDARSKVLVDPKSAVQRIKEGTSLLSAPLQELEKSWQKIDNYLVQLKYQIRFLQRVLRRSRISDASFAVLGQGRSPLTIRVYPDINGNGLVAKVTSNNIWKVKLQLFALDGKLLLGETATSETALFHFDFLDSGKHTLANGIYLYVITAYCWNNEVIRSKVDKLVILR